jgi:hypothetical protein
MSSLLVLGGARSGKSRYAQHRAEQSAGPLAFIATAQAFDAEMAARIARHQEDRDGRWHTIEAPFDLPCAIRQASETHGAILVDCLTLWVSNLMLAERDIGDATGPGGERGWPGHRARQCAGAPIPRRSRAVEPEACRRSGRGDIRCRRPAVDAQAFCRLIQVAATSGKSHRAGMILFTFSRADREL